MKSANNVHRTAAAPNPQRSLGGERPSGSNFIRHIIVRDLESNKFSGHVVAGCANQTMPKDTCHHFAALSSRKEVTPTLATELRSTLATEGVFRLS